MEFINKCSTQLEKIDKKSVNSIIPDVSIFASIDSEELFKSQLFQFYKDSLIFISNFFNHLNKSVLAGEYTHKEFSNLYGELYERVYGFFKDTEILEEPTFGIQEFDNIYYKCILSPVYKALKHYKELHTLFEQKISKGQELYNFSIFRDVVLDERIIEKFNYDNVLHELHRFANQTIQITKIDLRFVANPKNLERLVLIYQSISNNDNQSDIDYYNLNKSSFLLYKIIQRLSRDKRNYRYVVEFQDKEIDKESLVANVGVFHSLMLTSDLHYSNQIRGRDQIREFELTLAQESSNLIEYHGALKYYKDHFNEATPLIKLVNEFPNISENSKNIEFDQRAHSISFHFAENNEFSKNLENDVVHISFIQDYLRRCKEYQKEHRVLNYFPYFKAIQYLEKRIKADMIEHESKSNSIDDALDVYENAKKAFYQAREWSYDRNYIAFQAFHDDCFIKGQDPYGEGMTLFLMSTCILPINYEEVDKNVEELISSIDEMKAIHHAKKEINVALVKIKGADKLLKEVERKNIEILSIFAAIVLFVTSNIKLFSEIDNTHESLKFMIVMAYIMGLFVLLIWLITSTPSSQKITSLKYYFEELPLFQKSILKLYVLSSVAITVLIWFPINSDRSKTNEKEIIELKKSIRSLDSIFHNTEINKK